MPTAHDKMLHLVLTSGNGLQVDAHSVGCTAVSWSPAAPPGSLVSGKAPTHAVARFATAGCDRTVRVSSAAWQQLHIQLTYVIIYHNLFYIIGQPSCVCDMLMASERSIAGCDLTCM